MQKLLYDTTYQHPQDILKTSKPRYLDGALVEQILTAVDLADQGHMANRGDMGAMHIHLRWHFI